MKCKSAIIILTFVLMCGLTLAAELEWDTSPTGGAQPGDGIWDHVTPYWWTGDINTAWTDYIDSAMFTLGDGSRYTVTLGEDISAYRVTFQQDVNCTLAGDYEIQIESGTKAFRAYKTTGVIVDCDLATSLDPNNTTDPEIQVNGKNRILTINGDIHVRERSVHVTEDLIFRRNGTGAGYAFIEVNGDILFDTSEPNQGTCFIIGHDKNNVRAATWVTCNGLVDLDDQRLTIRTGGVMELGGRLEADYILMDPSSQVNEYSQYKPRILGTPDQSGVLALRLAGYNGECFIDSKAPRGGMLEAADLNLEIDLAGIDFDDPAADAYVLYKSEDPNNPVYGYVNGDFHSVTPINDPRAGAIVTVYNQLAGGEDFRHVDLFVETADLDGSGCIDFTDFALWAGAYGDNTCQDDTDGSLGDNCSGRDFNHSGAVDFVDLSLLVERWLSGSCP